ncbi:phage head spike fiber domain-containing protein [Roseomonas harenae]|uniref:phage head spike fiber domain-containing protein n=1 Tax=Muricoccus harenae TaxID=2692566 RepID=UPI0013317D5C|nr:hypothetical protein [Roseomonas harenae]
MIGTTLAIHALGGGPLRLISRGGLLPSLGFARASAALVLGATGTSWQQAGADAPRFGGTARRLIVEGARTNQFTNPRSEGAVPGLVGAGGQLPTGGSVAGDAGLSTEVVGTGAEDGLPYVELRIFGTPTASIYQLNHGGGTTPIAEGQIWTYSLFIRVTGGSTNGVNHFAPAFVTNMNVGIPTGTALRNCRVSASWSIASTGNSTGRLRISLATGQPVDMTFRLAVPQLELGAFASSPILPPAGTMAVSTRAADVPAYALPAAAQPRGTLIGTFILPQAAASGTEQGLLQLDDGGDGNRVILRNAAGGAAVEAALVSGGVTAAVLAGGTMSPGTPFRAALAWDPSGVALCMAGGAVQSAAAPPAGLARLLVGHAAAGLGRAAFGEIGPLDLHPTRLPGTALQALTTLS